jgi:nucleoside-diphosphate-sugar epimerase
VTAPAPVPSPTRARRVFLTGGTGLIGSHVAELLRRRGDEVVALVRSSSDVRHLERIGCDLVVGDMLDPPRAIAARMRGADAVIHAAAKVFQSGSRAEYERVNVEGTERVLAAAAESAPRFLQVSSVAVYAGLPLERLTEERWREADPARQARYAASKHLSERAAWSAHERGRVRLTTVRPGVVYGERDRSATPVLVRLATLPVLLIPGGGRTTVPVVYAGNVARGIVAALDRDASVGRAYNLALDTPITARELATEMARGLGRRPRVVALPAAPARFLAGAVDRLVRQMPGLDADLGRAVASLTTNNPYDSSRARLELGWRGLVPHAVGVRQTMEWWLARD